jgi:hypothetical protein
MRRHHPTGSLAGRHLDPDFFFYVDGDAHDSEHDRRRALKLDRGARAATPVERVELRLRRLGVFLAVTFAPLLAEGPPREFTVLMAAYLVTWADELTDRNKPS